MLFSTILAHAGHGTTDPESVSHLLLESQHNWLVFTVVALAALVVWAGKRKRAEAKQPAQTPEDDA